MVPSISISRNKITKFLYNAQYIERNHEPCDRFSGPHLVFLHCKAHLERFSMTLSEVSTLIPLMDGGVNHPAIGVLESRKP